MIGEKIKYFLLLKGIINTTLYPNFNIEEGKRRSCFLSELQGPEADESPLFSP